MLSAEEKRHVLETKKLLEQGNKGHHNGGVSRVDIVADHEGVSRAQAHGTAGKII